MKVIKAENKKLVIGEMPIPQISAFQVLIKVHAAGLNRADVFQKEGTYNPPLGCTDIIGLEVAGTIEKIGNAVRGVKEGDKVCAIVPGGGYAEYVAADEEAVLPLPKGYDFVKAAALPETLFTVWHALYNKAKLKAGETILVHGGASGIGTTAIQLAKVFGSKVISTAGTDEKCAFIKKLGADVAINYKKEDFVQIAKANTEGKGVNVVLDIVGGGYFQKNFSSLAFGGRLVILAFLEGNHADVNFAPLLMKELTIYSFRMRGQLHDLVRKITDELRSKVWPLIESGKISPVIDNVFPFEKAEEAQQRMKQFGHTGKIVLKVI